MANVNASTIPDGIYLPGVSSFAPVAVPQGISALGFTLDRTFWLDPAVTIDLSLQVSYDNGTTWQAGGAFTANGGIISAPGGGTQTTSSGSFSFSQTQSAQRKVMGSLTIAGGPLHTSGTLTVS